MFHNIYKYYKSGSSLEYTQLTFKGDPIDAYSVKLPILVEDISSDIVVSHVFMTYDQAFENYQLAREIGVNVFFGHIDVHVSELSMPELYKKIRSDVLSSNSNR